MTGTKNVSAFRPVEGFPCGHMGEISQVFSKMSCDVHRFHFFLYQKKPQPTKLKGIPSSAAHPNLLCSLAVPTPTFWKRACLLSRTFAAAGFQRWVKLLESSLLKERILLKAISTRDGVSNNWRSCSWRVLQGWCWGNWR